MNIPFFSPSHPRPQAIAKRLVSALAFGAALGFSLPGVAAQTLVEVYKNPNCGCCIKWVQHLQAAGFEVRTYDRDDNSAARTSLGMPAQYASCHTAKVGGYIVEGHVPASDIQRLLREKPRALGLAVPGMPLGSPGMEADHPMQYETLLIRRDSSASVYAKH